MTLVADDGCGGWPFTHCGDDGYGIRLRLPPLVEVAITRVA